MAETLGLLMLVLACFAPAVASGDDTALSPLTIVTPDRQHTFQVEVAASPQERARGLMFRTELAPERGMLFDFGREQPVSMWMRNTLIPLDMLFIGNDGEIRTIAQNTTPLSLETIASGVPVMAVLELNAGMTRLLGIGPGDRVTHPIFANAPTHAPAEAPAD
jgi:uncharacterized membrane protein (UPF0127 family)